MTDTTPLVTQLRALLTLTRTEEQVARIRIGQARTDAVRRELAQNADNADQRATAIATELRALAGVGDVLAPALGRLTAVVKGTFEQATPGDEALLQDLQLEHSLLDRATYLKVLAETAKQPKLVRLAERLITAHSATVEWLTVVLAEQALGGPAALQPTPLQRVAGGAARAANAPVRIAAGTVNRVVDTAQQAGEQTSGALNSVVDNVVERATSLGVVVRESLTAGRLATLRRAEQTARSEGDTEVARAVHETRRDLGDLTSDELPIKGYDDLTIAQVTKAVKELENAEQVTTVIRYEESHKNRTGVVNATQTRLAELAKDVVGVSN